MSFLGSSLPLVKSSSNHIFRDGISGFSFPTDGKSVSIPSSRALAATDLMSVLSTAELLLSKITSNIIFPDGFSFLIDGKSVNFPVSVHPVVKIGERSSSRALGGGSSSTIFFDPRTERETGEVFKISPDQLWETMLRCAEADGEDLGAVDVYKVPLESSQKSPIEGSVFSLIFNAFHMFVTIRIGRAYRSFERYAEGILVQRSLQADAVIKKSMKEDRVKGFSVLQTRRSESLGVSNELDTVNDLISVLKEEFKAIINSPFDALLNNCQHFVRKILRQMGFNYNN
ncbi:uncharacterized protein LOC108682330 [Hyalella azteca]|uniref:Uncharacterized protein LOC108682330 n=1 Tax=Hyalella azteca TaxID=294128 RepID=A0A8B7PLV1_HYAAZ|nr:uncharacterized protein LOC108682330 [Hyalella azteca]